MNKLTGFLGALVLAAGASAGCADKEDEPDNTGVNQRDRAETARTADHADMDQSDVDLMAKIRKRVVDADGLGTTAKNVKIIAEDGKVTLRGPVASAEEKSTIESIARDVAGGRVTSELEIAP